MENNKRYLWNEDTTNVSLTTKEFDALFNGLGAFLMTPISPQSYILVGDLHHLLQKKFQSWLEDGTIKVEEIMEKMPKKVDYKIAEDIVSQETSV